MRNKRSIKPFLMLMLYTAVVGIVTLQTQLIYTQGNLSQVLNQTSNQTGNQTGNLSLSPAIPGQQGGTPPKTGPS